MVDVSPCIIYNVDVPRIDGGRLLFKKEENYFQTTQSERVDVLEHV